MEATKPNPWLALLLTLDSRPGSGHHYLGRKGKAILFFSAW
jgi:hypothetical protein